MVESTIFKSSRNAKINKGWTSVPQFLISLRQEGIKETLEKRFHSVFRNVQKCKEILVLWLFLTMHKFVDRISKTTRHEDDSTIRFY